MERPLGDPRDLRFRDLRERDFAGADLSGFDLSWADLSGCSLRGAQLAGAKLVYANLAHARVAGADLRGAECRSMFAWGADFTGARFGRLPSAASRAARWGGRPSSRGFADLTSVNFTFARLERADLADAVMRGTCFIGADVTQARLASSTARYALLRYARGFEPEALPDDELGSLGWLPWDEGPSAVSPLANSTVDPAIERCAEAALMAVWCWRRDTSRALVAPDPRVRDEAGRATGSPRLAAVEGAIVPALRALARATRPAPRAEPGGARHGEIRDVLLYELAESCTHIDHREWLTRVLGRVAELGLLSEAAVDRTVRWSRGHRYDGELHWVPPDAR